MKNYLNYGLLSLALNACSDPGNTENESQGQELPDHHQCISDPEYRDEFPLQENCKIALAINVVLDSENEKIDESSIAADLEYARNAYNGIIADFEISPTVYYEREDIFNSSTQQLSTIEAIDKFVLANNKPGKIDIFYMPNYREDSNGTYYHGADTWPVTNEEGAIAIYAKEEGKSGSTKTLAHEIGHALGLEHPFENDDDGIEDTTNFWVECLTEEGNDVYPVSTALENEICIVSCKNHSISAPANLMDYFGCGEDGIQSITLQTLTNQQKAVINCRLSTDLSHYVLE